MGLWSSVKTFATNVHRTIWGPPETPDPKNIYDEKNPKKGGFTKNGNYYIDSKGNKYHANNGKVGACVFHDADNKIKNDQQKYHYSADGQYAQGANGDVYVVRKNGQIGRKVVIDKKAERIANNEIDQNLTEFEKVSEDGQYKAVKRPNSTNPMPDAAGFVYYKKVNGAWVESNQKEYQQATNTFIDRTGRIRKYNLGNKLLTRIAGAADHVADWFSDVEEVKDANGKTIYGPDGKPMTKRKFSLGKTLKTVVTCVAITVGTLAAAAIIGISGGTALAVVGLVFAGMGAYGAIKKDIELDKMAKSGEYSNNELNEMHRQIGGDEMDVFLGLLMHRSGVKAAKASPQAASLTAMKGAFKEANGRKPGVLDNVKLWDQNRRSFGAFELRHPIETGVPLAKRGIQSTWGTVKDVATAKHVRSWFKNRSEAKVLSERNAQGFKEARLEGPDAYKAQVEKTYDIDALKSEAKNAKTPEEKALVEQQINRVKKSGKRQAKVDEYTNKISKKDADLPELKEKIRSDVESGKLTPEQGASLKRAIEFKEKLDKAPSTKAQKEILDDAVKSEDAGVLDFTEKYLDNTHNLTAAEKGNLYTDVHNAKGKVDPARYPDMTPARAKRGADKLQKDLKNAKTIEEFNKILDEHNNLLNKDNYGPHTRTYEDLMKTIEKERGNFDSKGKRMEWFDKTKNGAKKWTGYNWLKKQYNKATGKTLNPTQAKARANELINKDGVTVEELRNFRKEYSEKLDAQTLRDVNNKIKEFENYPDYVDMISDIRGAKDLKSLERYSKQEGLPDGVKDILNNKRAELLQNEIKNAKGKELQELREQNKDLFEDEAFRKTEAGRALEEAYNSRAEKFNEDGSRKWPHEKWEARRRAEFEQKAQELLDADHVPEKQIKDFLDKRGNDIPPEMRTELEAKLKIVREKNARIEAQEKAADAKAQEKAAADKAQKAADKAKAEEKPADVSEEPLQPDSSRMEISNEVKTFENRSLKELKDVNTDELSLKERDAYAKRVEELLNQEIKGARTKKQCDEILNKYDKQLTDAQKAELNAKKTDIDISSAKLDEMDGIKYEELTDAQKEVYGQKYFELFEKEVKGKKTGKEVNELIDKHRNTLEKIDKQKAEETFDKARNEYKDNGAKKTFVEKAVETVRKVWQDIKDFIRRGSKEKIAARNAKANEALRLDDLDALRKIRNDKRNFKKLDKDIQESVDRAIEELEIIEKENVAYVKLRAENEVFAEKRGNYEYAEKQLNELKASEENAMSESVKEEQFANKLSEKAQKELGLTKDNLTHPKNNGRSPKVNTEYLYDAEGKCIGVRRSATRYNAEGNPTTRTIEYDAKGNPVRVSEQVGDAKPSELWSANKADATTGGHKPADIEIPADKVSKTKSDARIELEKQYDKAKAEYEEAQAKRDAAQARYDEAEAKFDEKFGKKPDEAPVAEEHVVEAEPEPVVETTGKKAPSQLTNIEEKAIDMANREGVTAQEIENFIKENESTLDANTRAFLEERAQELRTTEMTDTAIDMANREGVTAQEIENFIRENYSTLDKNTRAFLEERAQDLRTTEKAPSQLTNIEEKAIDMANREGVTAQEIENFIKENESTLDANTRAFLEERAQELRITEMTDKAIDMANREGVTAQEIENFVRENYSTLDKNTRAFLEERAQDLRTAEEKAGEPAAEKAEPEKTEAPKTEDPTIKEIEEALKDKDITAEKLRDILNKNKDKISPEMKAKIEAKIAELEGKNAPKSTVTPKKAKNPFLFPWYLPVAGAINANPTPQKEQPVIDQEKDPTKVNDDPTKVNDDSTKVNDDSTKVNDDSTKVNDDSTKVNDDSTKVNDDSTKVNDDSTKVNDDSTKVNDDSTKVNEDDPAKAGNPETKAADLISSNKTTIEDIDKFLKENGDKISEATRKLLEDKKAKLQEDIMTITARCQAAKTKEKANELLVELDNMGPFRGKNLLIRMLRNKSNVDIASSSVEQKYRADNNISDDKKLSASENPQLFKGLEDALNNDKNVKRYQRRVDRQSARVEKRADKINNSYQNRVKKEQK